MACLIAARDFGEPVEDEPFAHCAHDCVVAVDRRGAAGDQADLARPCEGSPAVCADVAGPGAVVDFAERGEHGGSRVSVHAEDGAEIFGDDDSEVPDAAEEAAFRVRGFLPFRRAGEQRGFGECRGGVDVAACAECGEELGLAATGRADEEEPNRVSVEQVRGFGAECRVERADVGEVQPALKHGDDAGELVSVEDGRRSAPLFLDASRPARSAGSTVLGQSTTGQSWPSG